MIPVRTSFLSASGLEVVPPELPESGVLLFTDKEQSFEFTQIPQGTIPVVFRDFSAPVKLSSLYTEQDYLNLLEHCDDPFIRVDAQRSLVNAYIHQNIDKADLGELPEPTAIINAVGYVLKDAALDLQLKALLIVLPSFESVIETFKKVNLDALSAIYRKLSRKLALALHDDYQALEHATRACGKYHYDVANAARRAAQNAAQYMVALGYVAAADSSEDDSDALMHADDLISRAYYDANNMTDRYGAITTAVKLDLPCKAALLEHFEDSYGSDPLTFDKFFAMQAAVPKEDTVKTVRKLLEHPRFDLTNPNRVRALVGTLGYNNPVALHRRDGTGYLLIYDVVKQLNSINPSMAARILDGMMGYRRFDAVRQAKAEEYLNKIRNIDGLNRAVFEKVNAALTQEHN